MTTTQTVDAVRTTDQPPRVRRWVPLTLRLGLAMLLPLSIWSGSLWFRGYRVAQLELELARELTAHKWAVHYDYEEFEYGYDPAQTPAPRPWYHRALPDDARPRIVCVSLPSMLSTEDRADLIARISQMPFVRHLSFGTVHCLSDGMDDEETDRICYAKKIPMNERDLEHIGGMFRLEILDLTGTTTTDAGLIRLSRLKHLKRLCLRGTHVTAEGVRRLQLELPQAEIYSRFGR